MSGGVIDKVRPRRSRLGPPAIEVRASRLGTAALLRYWRTTFDQLPPRRVLFALRALARPPAISL